MKKGAWTKREGGRDRERQAYQRWRIKTIEADGWAKGTHSTCRNYCSFYVWSILLMCQTI